MMLMWTISDKEYVWIYGAKDETKTKQSAPDVVIDKIENKYLVAVLPPSSLSQ